jgi:hypothetical protein
VVFNNQCEEKTNDFRNRFAKGRHSETGEEVWSEQPIRRYFESAFNFVAKSNGGATTEKSVSSEVCKF